VYEQETDEDGEDHYTDEFSNVRVQPIDTDPTSQWYMKVRPIGEFYCPITDLEWRLNVGGWYINEEVAFGSFIYQLPDNNSHIYKKGPVLDLYSTVMFFRNPDGILALRDSKNLRWWSPFYFNSVGPVSETRAKIKDTLEKRRVGVSLTPRYAVIQQPQYSKPLVYYMSQIVGYVQDDGRVVIKGGGRVALKLMRLYNGRNKRI
jgi:hypothetical protein